MKADPQPVPPWERRTHRHDARWGSHQNPTRPLLSASRHRGL